MRSLEIQPLSGAPDVDLELPGSKSITNRCLLIAALASGVSRLARVLIADDTEAMLDCIRSLGAAVRFEPEGTTAEVEGVAGAVPSHGSAFARQSGTTARFVAPVLALANGAWELDGDPHLRARPMADLFDALERLHVVARPLGASGHLPVEITGPIVGSRTTVAGNVSSQFLSGLLLASPLFPAGLEIAVEGELVSRPYVEMTLQSMRRFGAIVEVAGSTFSVTPGGYKAAEVEIEPDASGASYFLAAAAITGGRVRVLGLGKNSMQGDVAFADVLGEMGADVRWGEDYLEVEGTGSLQGVERDLADFSDMVPTLAVVAAFADSPTRIRGVGFIRRKESDRVGAFAAELRRCGVNATEEPDGLRIEPSRPHGARVTTYADHRVAMAFAVLGLAVPGVELDDRDCVAKTFPDFFDRLELLRS